MLWISASAIGPSAKLGMKVSAPTIRITPTKSPTKSREPVGKVPALGGVTGFWAMEPAMARTGTKVRKRPTAIAMPSP